MSFLRAMIAGIFAISLLSLTSCTSHPVELQFAPEDNQVQAKQYTSSLRFGFVTFEDVRMVPVGTGQKKMVGWGTNTYYTDVDVAEHVTESFVRQYRYLGFKSTWIKSAPPNFSFSSRDWVRSLRLQYPNIDVFVIGKIKDYQFQLSYGGFIEGTGQRFVQAQSNVEVYYINGQSGRFIWGDTIHHRGRGVIKDRPPLEVAAEKTETTLQRVILDFADRSVSHLAKEFPGSIRVTSNGLAGIPAGSTGTLSPQAANPNLSPVPAGKGRLVVTTTPPGAKIYIDGVFYGTSPLLLDIPSGIHLLKVRLHGYKTFRDKIGVLEQKITTWDEHLHRQY
ncbi:MAG: PEGA domain-containing protein [Leptospirales bacterium]